MLFSDVVVVVMAAPLFSFPFPGVASMPVIAGVRLTLVLALWERRTLFSDTNPVVGSDDAAVAAAAVAAAE